MSKTIKLNEDTYNALEDLQEKRETKDQALKRLIDIYRMVKDLTAAIPAAHFVRRPPSDISGGD